jgi:hypothetical protein
MNIVKLVKQLNQAISDPPSHMNWCREVRQDILSKKVISLTEKDVRFVVIIYCTISTGPGFDPAILKYSRCRRHINIRTIASKLRQSQRRIPIALSLCSASAGLHTLEKRNQGLSN